MFSQLQIAANSSQDSTVSIVGTSMYDKSTAHSFQRQVFYSKGRFWVFFSNGLYMAYSTSIDGITWTGWASVMHSQHGMAFSSYSNGSHVAIIGVKQSGTVLAYYRLGALNESGIIDWATPLQYIGGDSSLIKLDIALDSDGYPYVTYSRSYSYVTKSSMKNGSWTTASGYPISLVSYRNYQPAIVPLANRKMYVVCTSLVDGAPVIGRLYNGTAWLPEEQISVSNMTQGRAFSVSSYGDDVHLVFLK